MKTKLQISCAVTAQLFSAFVFATQVVQFLFFLNPKFQVSSLLLWLYRLVCVGPGKKSWTTFLAHLNRRLTRWAYSIVVEPSCVCPSVHIFRHLLLWNRLADESQILCGACVGGTKVCSRDLDHMTKMAATPIYGKNHSKIFSRTDGSISTKLGM